MQHGCSFRKKIKYTNISFNPNSWGTVQTTLVQVDLDVHVSPTFRNGTRCEDKRRDLSWKENC